MSSQVFVADEVTFDQVFQLAQQLAPVDQARLVARLAPKIEWFLEQTEKIANTQMRQPLRGLLADLGTAPSADEIDEVQQEMWATFAQE
ncbi:MAG: hypothetical protein R3E79_53940 [Caldilineaceae bacterium]